MNHWNREKIVSLLEQSGRIAMEYKTKMAPEMKSDNSIVTQADKAIEAFLDEAFTDEANNVFVIGEESIDSCSLSKALDNTAFIIDPIDGTAVYAAGLPMWGISIGYAVKGVMTESAVYLPETEELMITESGKTYLRCGNNNAFTELKPFRKEYMEVGAVYITQTLAKHGFFDGAELLHSIGSCVYPGVYLAKQAYLAGIYFAKIWDVAGILPALKNLGFCSVSEDGSDLMSLKISPEVYDMDISSGKFLKMKGIHVISSTEESCRRISEKITFPEHS